MSFVKTTSKTIVIVLLATLLLMLVKAHQAKAHDLTASEKKIYKHKWQLSAYKKSWYDGPGHWTLRPRFDNCKEIRWKVPRGRCYKHRTGYRWHVARMARIGHMLWPPPVVQQQTSSGSLSYWSSKQIAAAEVLGYEGDQQGTDPWPNCPDPYDHGGASWINTLNCENGGNWYDSPGYFRCGLQFEPAWERRFGQLCP